MNSPYSLYSNSKFSSFVADISFKFFFMHLIKVFTIFPTKFCQISFNFQMSFFLNSNFLHFSIYFFHNFHFHMFQVSTLLSSSNFLSTHLKKSSLQNNWPFRIKHFSLSCAWQSLHCRHFACHVRSDTLRMNRSNINSWQPPHFGIVAVKEKW